MTNDEGNPMVTLTHVLACPLIPSTRPARSSIRGQGRPSRPRVGGGGV